MKRLFVILYYLFMASICHADGVLYWMVDDSAVVDDGGTQTSIFQFVNSFGTYDYEEDGVTYQGYNAAARVRVTGSGLSSPYYLPIYFAEGISQDGYLGVEFGDVGGYFGSGVPTGNQSSLRELEGSPMFMEFAFAVEIGNCTWNDVAQDLDWITVAQSDEFAADQLTRYIHETFDIYPNPLDVWTPTTFYTVPEPSISILFILGIATIALRRKTAHRCAWM